MMMEKDDKKIILVTGGSGLVGRAIKDVVQANLNLQKMLI
jgi:hypothetical protein